MTEKRFNCHVKFSTMPNGIMVLDYERHGDEQTVIEDINREKAHRVMDRLNELNDENEQLKKTNQELNDELQETIGYLSLKSGVEKENEQLKSTIKEVIELLSEEVDLFTDKATEHDINAYIELKELDNKDAFYMAIATKKAIKMLKELQE